MIDALRQIAEELRLGLIALDDALDALETTVQRFEHLVSHEAPPHNTTPNTQEE